VKLFISTADDSEDVPKVDKGQPTYNSYRLSKDEWDLLALIQQVLAVFILPFNHIILVLTVVDVHQAAAEVQEAFSAEYYPTIWRVLPLYEDFIAKWKEFAADPNMFQLWPAIEAGLESLEKYYNKTDDSPVHIVSMCK
jgi:hypothetical protein